MNPAGSFPSAWPELATHSISRPSLPGSYKLEHPQQHQAWGWEAASQQVLGNERGVWACALAQPCHRCDVTSRYTELCCLKRACRQGPTSAQLPCRPWNGFMLTMHMWNLLGSRLPWARPRRGLNMGAACSGRVESGLWDRRAHDSLGSCLASHATEAVGVAWHLSPAQA